MSDAGHLEPIAPELDPAGVHAPAVVERALNLLKSVMLLCGDGHWEVATAANRQLFELLINMEHVAAQPDRDRAIKQYMKFGLMQTLELAVASLEYSQATSRPVNTADLAGLKQALADNFDEFRSKKNRRRNQTWSGKNARQLAELSGKKSRTDQYRLLYTPWSEQTHCGAWRPAGPHPPGRSNGRRPARE